MGVAVGTFYVVTGEAFFLQQMAAMMTIRRMTTTTTMMMIINKLELTYLIEPSRSWTSAVTSSSSSLTAWSAVGNGFIFRQINSFSFSQVVAHLRVDDPGKCSMQSLSSSA